VLDWPGNLPDLNPIQNLWSIRKARLQTFDCTTKTMLVAPSFKQSIATVNQGKLSKAVKIHDKASTAPKFFVSLFYCIRFIEVLHLLC